MDTYKEITKEDVLKLKEGDIVYYKNTMNCDVKYYVEGIIKHDLPNYTFGIWRKANSEDTNYSYADVCINELITDKRYINYTFYIQVPAYSATEIIQKIENGELQDDDILIDKNGTEDKVYDILEQCVLSLIDYQPYQIKEREYMRLEEAILSKKKIKHKDDDKFRSLTELMYWINQKQYRGHNYIQDIVKKVWEVEK